ncbi:MAG: U32 family peptidase [Spirochaetaceae bacterium]|nr:U32 family peptidase [Spirochaetaceae bacterium]
MMVELLAPCGSVETLNAAINEGADAVYLGLKTFNARMRSTNFSWSQFQAAVEMVHKRGKKIYVTLNTVITEDELVSMFSILQFLQEVGPDALIVQDLGLVQLVRDFFPRLKLHASTQMNIASSKAANAMSRSGISRVVLARELSLDEIRTIKKNTSCELEVFVHGALCISESGICLFSSFLGGKSANRGMCTQACRRLYTVENSEKKISGYFFSPYDLQLLEFIPELVDAGVSSFKIEGRMKSAEYVGTVVSAYRYMLDNYQNNRHDAFTNARRILENDFARKKTTFLFLDNNLDKTLNPQQSAGTGIYIGKIASVASASEEKQLKRNKPNDLSEQSGKTQFASLSSEEGFMPEVGDSIRLHNKQDTKRESCKIKQVYELNGKTFFEIPLGFSVGDTVYLLQTKSMTKRYPDILPKNLERFTKKPHLHRERFAKIKQKMTTFFFDSEVTVAESSAHSKSKSNKKQIINEKEIPNGFYVQVSSIQDLHNLLNMRPKRVCINYNEDTRNYLVDKTKVLPFAKSEIFISLDPFVSEAQLESLEADLQACLDAGFKNFIVNNPAHISLLRNTGTNLVVGPYLYVFNRFALRWLHENYLKAFVSPLENSFDNLEATLTDFGTQLRNNAIITVFSYPALFRIRKPLPDTYSFTQVSDKTGDMYRLLSTPSQSFVLPERPFSITEKIATLQKKGYQKFLLDFSHTSVKKSDYKIIFSACLNSEGLTDTSKFNWKEGFYNTEKVESMKMQRTNAEKK